MRNWMNNNDKSNTKVFLRDYFEAVGGTNWEDFKKKLIEAHRSGEIRMSRLDFVRGVPAEMFPVMQASEVEDNGAQFHLIDVAYDGE